MSENYKKDIITKLRHLGFKVSDQTEYNLTVNVTEYLKHVQTHNEELLKYLKKLNPDDLNETDKSSLKFLLHIIIA